MKLYKYNLDKSSKKFVCPKCNKRTFVKYIETETGNYLNDEFGRCDRETSCSYHSTVKGETNNSFEVKYIAPSEPSFHNLELVDKSMNDYLNNNFIQFLKTIFTNEEVKKVTNKYLLGTSKFWNGATVFWQIDDKELVHAGKVLHYVSDTGKRYKTKEGKGLINWVHSILKLKDFTLHQSLFGLHLINETNQKTVAIVESEKTAVIMSVFKPEYVWLSTGGKGFLKYNMLLPIKQFKIVAFPDKGEYKDWLNKAVELNKFGFKIDVNDWLENSRYENGIDLADVYIDSLNFESEVD
ncbi:MAG: DUF6371 domain-containing protein [Flavobacterium sp.]|uniref:DUF6371 domain-containing protein n=1 Tax=Flavobacterium sp. TaxID=239 RepID=UPI003263FB81